MTISTSITKPLEKGYLQVDSTSRSGYTKYYKVPQKNAKVFCSELKKQDKDMHLYSNILLFTSIVAGILIASPFTKNMDSRLKQILVQTGFAVGLGAISSLGFAEYEENKTNELMSKHHAKQIYYRA